MLVLETATSGASESMRKKSAFSDLAAKNDADF
jgi:hypothetical protein